VARTSLGDHAGEALEAIAGAVVSHDAFGFHAVQAR